MILLTNTTDKLQIISGQAGALDVHISYVDLTSAGAWSGAGRQNTAIVTAAATDVLAAPGVSVIRNAKTINVRNAHASNSCDVTVLYNQNGTTFTLHKVTLRAGEALEYIEGVGWYLLATPTVTPLIKVLAADDTGGQNVNTAQPWFPTNGALTVAADTTYWLDAMLSLSRAAGTTSHTIGILFGGTATLTSIQYTALANNSDTDAAATAQRTLSRVATSTVVTGASTSATEQKSIKLDGIIRVNAAGTLIPQFIYSAAPGGAPTVKANSYFRLDYLGTGSFTTQGTWS